MSRLSIRVSSDALLLQGVMTGDELTIDTDVLATRGDLVLTARGRLQCYRPNMPIKGRVTQLIRRYEPCLKLPPTEDKG